MEIVAIALGVAILVILVLLTSCWNSRPRRRNRHRCNEGLSNLPPISVNPLANFAEGDNTGQYYSDTGTGLINQQLAKQYADLQNLKQPGDWNEESQYQSLEPEVYTSHDEYVADMNRSTSGASMMTIRSDDNDINPWIGLRRPDYHSVYPADDARVDSSETPSSMPSATRYLI